MKLKPNRKQDAPETREGEKNVDEENSDAKSNEREEEGGSNARPRTDREREQRPELDRPDRGS